VAPGVITVVVGLVGWPSAEQASAPSAASHCSRAVAHGTTQPSARLPEPFAATQAANTEVTADGGLTPGVFQTNLDGVGGMAFTSIAMPAHAPRPGRLGRPVVSTMFGAGHDKTLSAVVVSLPVTERIEVGLSHQSLHLGSLRSRVGRATTLDMGTHHVAVETVSLKYVVVPEGGLSLDWMPAVAVGAHYKRNCEILRINRKLRGALRWMGVDDDDGIDFTVTASRQFDSPLAGPVLVSGGIRFTESNQTGFFGFTDGYRAAFEGNISFSITERLVVGAEYRQKPDRLRRVGSLYRPEDDFWAIYAGYRIDDHLSVGLGWVNLGRVANSREHAFFGLSVTYGF